MTSPADGPSPPVQAGQPAPVAQDSPALRELLAGAEARRDRLGRKVRGVWVEWAGTQSDAKPSWLVGWDDLGEGQREVDRLIGEALAEEGHAEAVRCLEFEETCLNCGRMFEECHRTDLRREVVEESLADMVALAEELLRYIQRGVEPNTPEEVEAAFRGRLERARVALRQDASCPRCGGSGQEPDCGDGDDKLRPHLGCRSTGMLGEPVCCGKHAPESGRSGVMPCSQCGGRDG